MVGENDIKGLFIYSIDEEIPVNAVMQLRKIKDGTVFFNTPWYCPFFCLVGDLMIKFFVGANNMIYDKASECLNY